MPIVPCPACDVSKLVFKESYPEKNLFKKVQSLKALLNANHVRERHIYRTCRPSSHRPIHSLPLAPLMLTGREILKGRPKNVHSVILGITIIGGLCLYFLPTIIAINRSANRHATIFFINLIFGWTIVGWIATVIWVVAQNARDGELPRSSAVESDTWIFEPSKLNDPSTQQSDHWVWA